MQILIKTIKSKLGLISTQETVSEEKRPKKERRLFEPPVRENKVKVALIGVGGGGSNSVDSIIASGVNVDLSLAINTDKQALRVSKAEKRVQIGSNLTYGYGAGARPEIGKEAAEDCREQIASLIKYMDVVFITACMGGGTGSGASPVIADIAHSMGKLVIAFVTTPFVFEGEARMKNAKEGVEKLREYADAVAVIENERLTDYAKANAMSTKGMFAYADDIIRQNVSAIANLINNNGAINVDFADVRAILGNGGDMYACVKTATGETRASDVARAVVEDGLCAVPLVGMTRAIVTISGGDVKMDEMSDILSAIKEKCAPNAKIIFGTERETLPDNALRVALFACAGKLFETDKA